MREKKMSWNDSAPAGLENSEPTTRSWDFIKVYREPLEHLMFRGRMDWIGAWLLIQAAADWQTHRVNLTEVGRRADHDFGWDNDRWRRFVKRLEKEGFVATIDKQNFGSKIGHVHIALIACPTLVGSPRGSSADAFSGAQREQSSLEDEQSIMSVRSVHPDDAGAKGDASAGAEGRASTDGVWLVIDDIDEEDVS